MLILLSPAKKQNFDFLLLCKEYTIPKFQNEVKTLIETIKKYNISDINKLMSISEKLGQLNYQRFQGFDLRHVDLENAKPAVYAFEGDVYQHLQAKNLSADALSYMQSHLLILSGLYGYLRPLDLIQPHRLEMGTNLKVGKDKNLYQFWGHKITDALNDYVVQYKHKLIINLASKEYFQSVKSGELKIPVLNIEFKEKRGNDYKIFGINAKRTRGMMARFIIENKIDNAEDLKNFNQADYGFNSKLSSESCLCFSR